ncbi:hypothetical protein ACOMHN_053024 [Nucella lapillus]
MLAQRLSPFRRRATHCLSAPSSPPSSSSSSYATPPPRSRATRRGATCPGFTSSRSRENASMLPEGHKPCSTARPG